MIFHFRVLTKINYACKLVKEKINPEFFMDIKIRKFEDRDAARVAVIMFGSFRAVFGDLLGTEPKPESYWKEISHSERGGIIVTSFVAETDNNVIGYLRVSINPGNGLGVLEVIGVDPESFSRGIGKALFAAAEVFWKKNNIRKVYTCTSHINTNAQAFYKKLGFIEEGRLKDHFHKGLDEIQLGKFYD